MMESHKLRLSVAVAFSALIHLSLLIWMRPQPVASGTQVGSVLRARLERLAVQSPAVPIDVPEESPKAAEEPRPDITTSALPPAQEIEQDLEAAPGETPPLEIPLIVDTTFYPTRELDVFPKPIAAITPVFPKRATDEQVSGTVTLELMIDETGAVQEVKIIAADPEGYFEESAVQSFRSARFTPAQKDGRSVRSRMAIAVDFTFDPEAMERLTRAVR